MGAGEFYSLCVGMPLGLRLTKVEEGIEGGSAAAGGQVAAGDLLHAVTMVADRSDIGMRTEDFVSSVVGGFGRFRQSLVDTTFINTPDDLVDVMRSNSLLGGDTKLTLIFERNVDTSAPPANPLQ